MLHARSLEKSYQFPTSIGAGCKRKFASLWRLKVHYRAPPNERGSGKERGHGVELPICPACGESLQPKTHHNRCRAGRTSQPAKSAIKQRSKGNRSTHTSASAKRRASKDELQSDAMASAADAIGDTTALTDSAKPLYSKMFPACPALEYLPDLPHSSFLVRNHLRNSPFRHRSVQITCQRLWRKVPSCPVWSSMNWPLHAVVSVLR